MLYIEPHAGSAPLVRLIEAARHQIEANVYEISDRSVERALENACRHGVKVRLMIDTNPYGGKRMVRKAERAFGGSCVQMRSAPPRFQKPYVFDHAKYLVIDPGTRPQALVGTANWSYSAFHKNREYLYTTSDKTTVGALNRVFNADWARRRAGGAPRRHIVLSPGAAKLFVQMLSQRGPVAVEAEEVGNIRPVLRALAAKGSQARLIVPSSVSRRDRGNIRRLERAGVKVRSLRHPYMHAKLILTHRFAFIGSQNISASSLNRNREVGVLLGARQDLSRLSRQFDADWGRAHLVR